MRLVSADKSTGQFPNPPPGEGGDGSTTRMLIRPVFTKGADRRRKMLVRGGYLLAASCVAYLAMVLVSITASPSARPAANAEPGVTATTVNQVTPARPSQKPAAVAPATVRPRPVVPVAPPASSAAPVSASATAAASVAPSATVSAKPTKKAKASASKTPKASATRAP